jgi:hypothetical protein
MKEDKDKEKEGRSNQNKMKEKKKEFDKVEKVLEKKTGRYQNTRKGLQE